MNSTSPSSLARSLHQHFFGPNPTPRASFGQNLRHQSIRERRSVRVCSFPIVCPSTTSESMASRTSWRNSSAVGSSAPTFASSSSGSSRSKSPHATFAHVEKNLGSELFLTTPPSPSAHRSRTKARDDQRGGWHAGRFQHRHVATIGAMYGVPASELWFVCRLKVIQDDLGTGLCCCGRVLARGLRLGIASWGLCLVEQFLELCFGPAAEEEVVYARLLAVWAWL